MAPPRTFPSGCTVNRTMEPWTKSVGDTGSVRLGAALASIWKRPGSIKDMWNLREKATFAAERLAGFLAGVIEQLYAADH